MSNPEETAALINRVTQRNVRTPTEETPYYRLYVESSAAANRALKVLQEIPGADVKSVRWAGREELHIAESTAHSPEFQSFMRDSGKRLHAALAPKQADYADEAALLLAEGMPMNTHQLAGRRVLISEAHGALVNPIQDIIKTLTGEDAEVRITQSGSQELTVRIQQKGGIHNLELMLHDGVQNAGMNKDAVFILANIPLEQTTTPANNTMLTLSFDNTIQLSRALGNTITMAANQGRITPEQKDVAISQFNTLNRLITGKPKQWGKE